MLGHACGGVAREMLIRSLCRLARLVTSTWDVAGLGKKLADEDRACIAKVEWAGGSHSESECCCLLPAHHHATPQELWGHPESWERGQDLELQPRLPHSQGLEG